MKNKTSPAISLQSIKTQPAHCFRQELKQVAKNIGILPLLRLIIKAAIAVSVLPLQIVTKIMDYYIKCLHFINPNNTMPRDFLSRHVSQSTAKIRHNNIDMTFYTPNALCQYRADTFSSKEPETLDWLDRFGRGGVLFDIGANIGLYSVYYAKSQQASVCAFEPSVFNLGLLVKNININNLQAKIKVVCNPLFSDTRFANFQLPSSVEGGALSGFGVEYGQDGTKLVSTLSYNTFGMSLDEILAANPSLEKPAIIKIDVDGIEHLILEGARKTLADPTCRSVLVELCEDFELQASTVKKILTACGFTFKYKSSINHIWVKE